MASPHVHPQFKHRMFILSRVSYRGRYGTTTAIEPTRKQLVNRPDDVVYGLNDRDPLSPGAQ